MTYAVMTYDVITYDIMIYYVMTYDVMTYVKKLLMTPHLDRHSKTDQKPEMQSAV